MKTVEAVSFITDVFLKGWPKKHPVSFTNIPATKDGKCTWARLTINHSGGTQLTMADDQGCRKYENYGIITVQIFTPIGSSQITGLTLAENVLNAFRETSGAVMFTNHGISDIGADGLFNQTQVNIDFNYTQTR